MSRREHFSPVNTTVRKVLPAAEDLQKLYDKVSSLTGSASPGTYFSPQGNFSSPLPENWFWIKITAVDTSGAKKKYSWERVIPRADGSYHTTGDGPFGFPATCPGYEFNDALVPVNTYAIGYPSVDGDSLFFHAKKGSVGGSGPGDGACRLAALRHDDCISVTDGDITLYIEGTAGTWTSVEEYYYGFDSGVLSFWYDAGAVHLSLNGMELLHCGDGCFTGGALTGHAENLGSGSGGFEYCDGDSFTLCVSCACCSIGGWEGPGWYCVREAGTANDCTPVELIETDRCDSEIEVCSGPYDTYELAEANCPPSTVETDCCGNPISTTLTMTITDKDGIFTCLPDTLSMVYNPFLEQWRADVPYSACSTFDTYFRLSCNPFGEVTWFLDFTYSGGNVGSWSPDPGWACSPLNVVFTVPGTATFTITE